MEDIVLEIVAGAASVFFQEKVSREDVESVGNIMVWVTMAVTLFGCKTDEQFCKQCGVLRRDSEFVGPIKQLVAKYKNYNEDKLHFQAQCLIRKIIESVLIFNAQLKGTEGQETTTEERTAETTDAAHRYFLGFILYRLGKKFGFDNFRGFVLERDVSCEETEGMWWTAGVNRGGLMFCGEEFYLFFKKVLATEDVYFEKSTKSTKVLLEVIAKDVELSKGWNELPWEGIGCDELKKKAFKEAVRLHVGGRSRVFVKSVKESHKVAKRLCLSKKPLRHQLAEKK